MANLSKTTRDREEIRRWAEERGGKPAHVKGTGSGEDVGMLRIDFPGYTGAESLESITWEEFFEKFGERDLALVYQEETAGGQKSNFNKLVSAETAAEKEARGRRAAKASRPSSKKAASKAGGSGSSSRKRTAGSSKKTSARKGAAKKSSSKKSAGKKGPVKKSSGRSRSKARSSGARSSGTKRRTAKKSAAKRRR